MRIVNSAKKFFAPLEKFLTLEFVWLVTIYFRKRKINYPKISLIFLQAIRLVVNKLKIIRADNSYLGEFQVIENTLNTINLPNKYLVDIGASDGITQSSTVKLLTDRDYSGSLFEYNPESFSKLAFLYDSRIDIKLAKNKCTPSNIISLMEGFEVPKDFEFLNLDIDSYDLEVLRSVLKGGFIPKVISMEINPIFPPNIEFEVKFSDDQVWQGDHFFGCSISSAEKALQQFGYLLVKIEYNNAIFIHKLATDRFSKIRSTIELYDEGYRDKFDRKQRFPNSLEVEFLMDGSRLDAFQKINDLFCEYKGKYELSITH
jgi:hypothetical protein